MRMSTTFQTLAVGFAGLSLVGCAGTPKTEAVTRDFNAVTTAGDEVSGESIRGQVTIGYFWAVF